MKEYSQQLLQNERKADRMIQFSAWLAAVSITVVMAVTLVLGVDAYVEKLETVEIVSK